MRSSLLTLCLVAALALPAAAQVGVTVTANADNGVCLVHKDGTRVIQNFAANTTFSTYAWKYIRESSPSYTYLSHTVYPPFKFFNGQVMNRVGIYNYAYARKGSGHQAMQTTNSKTGAAGAQKYTVALSSATATNVVLDIWAYGYIYDNSTASIKISNGTTVLGSWSWSKPGYNRNTLQVKVAVSGTVNITVESSGLCKPGAGTNKWYDGYNASMYMYVLPNNAVKVTKFGTGCGTGAISVKGTPVKGSYATIALDNGPKNGAASFLFGYSKTSFHFLKLPLPLDYMGAKGCALNVGFYYPWARRLDANGHAETRWYLSRYYSGKYYGQWLVIDPSANSAGITLTQGIEVAF